MVFVLYPVISTAQVYIDISNPSVRRIPIAIPVFKPMGGGEEAIARKGADILSSTLDFTAYFKILDRTSFLEDPKSFDPAMVNYKNWTAVGAELLTTGTAQIQGDTLMLDLRLFDTFKGNLLIGKRYKGNVNDLQKMIRKFCSEIIFVLTGNWGVFDSQITFVSTGTGFKEIYLCDFDGTNPQQVTSNRSISMTPAWSSDGNWIAYTSYVRKRPSIVIKSLSDRRESVVSEGNMSITPDWVPGQFNLAASISVSGGQEIYLLTGAGKIIKKITNSSAIDVSPAWAPDGHRFVFVSDKTGSPQIYVGDSNSGRADRLTFEGKYNTQPSWSPKGDKVAYSSMEGGSINIFVIGLDGRGSAQLTYNSGRNESPSWAPDGSMIVFASTREGGSKIYVMTAYGTDQRRLLSLPGEQTSPKWSPRVVRN